ncbi:hypothetical protein [Azospirillum sp. sgz301742]
MRRPARTLAVLAVLLSTGTASAQMDRASHDAGHHQGMRHAGTMPTLPGQDAFGAIQEIVGILEADPNTDWSKVDISALREHLIDMNELTLHAQAAPTPVDGGLRLEVTGAGRTLEAIQRMLPAHAREMNGAQGWAWKAEPREGGVTLTVTSADPRQATKIRALGFIGLMAQGGHHQMHHLAMARGEMVH